MHVNQGQNQKVEFISAMLAFWKETWDRNCAEVDKTTIWFSILNDITTIHQKLGLICSFVSESVFTQPEIRIVAAAYHVIPHVLVPSQLNSTVESTDFAFISAVSCQSLGCLPSLRFIITVLVNTPSSGDNWTPVFVASNLFYISPLWYKSLGQTFDWIWTFFLDGYLVHDSTFGWLKDEVSKYLKTLSSSKCQYF